ncbi:MAG: hypothetical protein FD126_3075, partial [Elusimicrobia bacterium]
MRIALIVLAVTAPAAAQNAARV